VRLEGPDDGARLGRLWRKKKKKKKKKNKGCDY